MDSQETLALASDKAFQKYLKAGEILLSTFRLVKFNKRNRNQERTFAITSQSLMNLKGKRLKRRIDFGLIAGVTKSQPSDEFIVHIPSEYDYRFSSPQKETIISEFGKAFKQSLNKVLYIWVAYEPSLKDLAMSKADKKKGNTNKLPTPETAVNFRAALEEEKNERNVRSQTIFTANPKNSEVTLKDFKILRVIGRGSFGKVMLVEKIDTGEPYAMKSLRKDALLEREQIEHTRTEKKIMEHVNHTFLVKLEYAFTTDDKIYFVMAYMRGGELFFHLKNAKKFPEEQARFYGASIALGLGHLHSLHVVYRDLKPENILLDDNGYAHLTDFGMAKFLPEGGSTLSFVGTPEYLAPEIIAGTGHGVAADWWSFGILLYEMMVGIPPFYNQNIQLMYELIQHGDLRFPTRAPLPPHAEDIIRKLLTRNPRERLGANGIDEIKSHPFFESIEWNLMLGKSLGAPFVPNISDPKTVDYVDQEFLDETAEHSVVPEHRLKIVQQNQEQFKGF